MINLGFHASIESKEFTFAEIASKESDCNSARRGGDLGPFGRGQMQSNLTLSVNWYNVTPSPFCAVEPFEEAT